MSDSTGPSSSYGSASLTNLEEMPHPENQGNAISMRRRLVTMALLTVINLLNYMDRYAVSGVLTKLQDYFDINDGYGGMLQTVYIFSYMIFSPLLGYLGDRFSRKRIMLIGSGIWILLMISATFAPRNMFWLFIGLRAFIGIGDASYVVVAPSLICDLFAGKARSRALMIFYFAIPFGSGGGFVVSSSIAEASGGHWQWGMRAVPAASIVVWLLLLVCMREPPRGMAEHAVARTTKRPGVIADLRQLAKTPTFIFVSLGVAAANFVTGAMAWWVTSMISHAADMPNTHITATNAERQIIFGAITCVGGAFGTFLGVYVAQIWGEGRWCLRPSDRAEPLTCGIFTGCAVPFLWIATHLIPTSLIGTYSTSFIAIALSCVSWAVTIDIIMNVVIPTRRSIASGIHNLIIHILGDGPGPYVVGVISDAVRHGDDSPSAHFYSLLKAFYVPNAVMIVCAIMFLITAIYYVRDRHVMIEHLKENDAVKNPPTYDDITSILQSKGEKF